MGSSATSSRKARNHAYENQGIPHDDPHLDADDRESQKQAAMHRVFRVLDDQLGIIPDGVDSPLPWACRNLLITRVVQDVIEKIERS